MNRRDFLKLSSSAVLAANAGCIARPMRVGSPDGSAIPDLETGTLVNDIHSQLNPTTVRRIVKPATVEDLVMHVRSAAQDGTSVCVAGGRHAMGGQQFVQDGVLVDTRALSRVLGFDREAGRVTVEGGIQWPQLIDYLDADRGGASTDPAVTNQWGIYQKQTGADRLSIAGALACNAHGRGLTLKPIIQQVVWFDLLGADGEVRRCSREENADLFRLATGGYGLFGIITAVQLQLRPRLKVRRVVELGETSGIMERFEQRIRDGYLYGDFQFTTDSTRDSFLRRGVFSCYQPVSPDTPLTPNPTRFNPEDWARLTFYSHRYKGRAFQAYSSRYLATSGQIYWADSQLSAAYVDNYHADLDRALSARVKGSEMITEIYVPRPKLAAFMEQARTVLRKRNGNVIYGTVRLIEKDDESLLAWAREPWACIVFNLHIEHAPESIDSAAGAFCALIDAAIDHGGSYYLTYHRWARKDQVERCHPRMREFLSLKRRHDPGELFQSDWYRHHREMFHNS